MGKFVGFFKCAAIMSAGVSVAAVAVSLGGGTAHAAEAKSAHAGRMHLPPPTSAGSGADQFAEAAVTYTPTNWPYVPPILGDGSDERGGKPAVRPLPIIKSNFDTARWMVSPYYPHPTFGGEAKFRTHCNFSHVANDDPIVAPGRPGASHAHMFFGNTLTNADSTYESLRTVGGSTCGGGPLNRSAYWFPAVHKDGQGQDGQPAIIKMDWATIYYFTREDRRKRLTKLYRGFNFVFGFNPGDPEDLRQKNEIAAANRIGTYGSYRYGGNGFVGWKCETSNGLNENSPVSLSANQPYLRNADGSATLTCPTTEAIVATISSPTCWDGKNLSSPDGRSHVRYAIRENNSGLGGICPQGWHEIPQLIVSVSFSHQGPDDYKEWYLASDRMNPEKPFLNGQSFHMDWFGAWDNYTMNRWMINCLGIKVGPYEGNPHSCIDTQFGDNTAGIVQSPAPDGTRAPQIDLKTKWATMGADRYIPVP